MAGDGSEAMAAAARDMMGFKMYSLAACVMIYYDILLTMRDEINVIWLQKRYNLVTGLYAVNRYLMPIGYAFVISGFHSTWKDETCNRHVLFPAIIQTVAAVAIGMLFILRLYAIYGGSKPIVGFGVILLVGEIALKIWAISDGQRLQLPPGPAVFGGCILSARNPTRFMFTWVAEVIFDSVIFLLTAWKTLTHYRRQSGQLQSLWTLVVRDGIVYFAVICAANIMNVVFFAVARTEIKAINASFSALVTSLMVSRLILNLKIQVADRPTTDAVPVSPSISYHPPYQKHALSLDDHSSYHPRAIYSI